jgi:hypothetical protein
MVDFYRQKDPSQTTSNSMLSNTNAGSKRECIKVCVRVRPLLHHERNKGEVIYYPLPSLNDTLDVSQFKF